MPSWRSGRSAVSAAWAVAATPTKACSRSRWSGPWSIRCDGSRTPMKEGPPLSLPAVEPPLHKSDSGDTLALRPPGAVRRSRVLRALLAAPVVGAIALALHYALPNGQPAPPTRLYPLLLQALIVATLVLAVVQWLWRALRPSAMHYGPLVAGAI